MFLLDTNVLSELRRHDRAHPAVAAWAGSTIDHDLFVSVISVLEIEQGILLLAQRDASQAAILRRWMDIKLMPSFAGRVLSVDVVVAKHCAALHVPDPRSERDAFIAATAIAHRMTVVTRNVSDFVPMKVAVVNPWEVGTGV